MFDLDDILDPASPEGAVFLGSSGFLDDDRPCECWCGCGRLAEWPDDECAACLEGRHPDPRDPEGRR